MKIGDVVETLAGLPVGTWARDSAGELWVIAVDASAERDIETANIETANDLVICAVPRDWARFAAVATQYGPFTICRPSVGAVLPSARYAPEGTWLRDREGSNWCMSHELGGAGLGGPDEWGLCVESGLDDYAPFTVIADPREARDSAATVTVGALAPVGFDNVDDLRRAASAAMERMADTVTRPTAATVPDTGGEDGPSPVARMLANMVGSSADNLTTASERHDRRIRECMALLPDGATAEGIAQMLRRVTPEECSAVYEALSMGVAASVVSQALSRGDSVRRLVERTQVERESFTADLRRRLRTPESTNPRRMTWGDAGGETSRRVAPRPEPMPRVDLITTGGDQSWRKARPVNRRPGRVEPVCGWSAYYD